MNGNTSSPKNIILLTGPLNYVLRDTDDVLNVDTTLGVVSITLPNIRNSGLDLYPRLISVNDISNTANTNNIILYPSGGDTINSAPNAVISVAGGSVKCTQANQNEWFISGPGIPGVENPITIENEGTIITSNVSVIDFTGSGVNATGLGGNVTVNIPYDGTVKSVQLSSGTGIGLTGTNPITTTGTITVTNTAPDQVVNLSDGTAIDVTGTYPNFTITNTAPDQVVSLIPGTGIGITGTYPNFTINNTQSLSGYVPYTGATTNLDLGTHNLTADHIALNVNPSGAGFVVGATQWNNTDGTSETILKGGIVTLKNGVDLVTRVVNKTFPNQTLTKAQYQVVKITGATGERLSVDLAQADIDLNSADTLGVVAETIAINQEGFILTVGQLLDVNTTGSLQGESWSDGDVLYLSPTIPGAMTKVKPNGSTGHIVVLGYVEYAHPNNGKIYVKIMNGWELDELHNVYINNPLNGQLLSYVTPENLWENKTLGNVLGGSASQYVRGDGTLASFPDVAGGGGGQVYYFNGGVTEGTIGGSAFKQISTAANIPSSSVNFTSGTVDNVAFANFITDIGKPTQETVPAGAWIFQCYLSASATSTCQVYATVEVYDGTTFTVLATSLVEVITNNTTKDLYTFTCAVPEYTPLAPDDRIAVRFYPANLGGNTITLYTQDSNLSSLQTTFSTGISSLNGLTTSAQYFEVGFSGTDFNIDSMIDTHTFNLPDASATSRGALTNGDWTTFNNKVSTSRSISTSAPLTGGGDLSANRTLSISQANATTDGYLSSGDWSTFNSKIGGSGTTNEISYFTASGTIASLTTATYPNLTELSYVKGVTSAIQTQLNGKQGTITLTTTGTSGASTLIGDTLNIPQYAGNPVSISDEGSVITSAVSSINFTGAGVTASAVGNNVTVNIPNTGGTGTVNAMSAVYSFNNFR